MISIGFSWIWEKKNQANMRTLLAILLSWGYKSLLKMTYCGTVNSKMATVKKTLWMIQQKEQDFKYCPINWYYNLPCYIKPNVTI